jgi:hypothetical protein
MQVDCPAKLIHLTEHFIDKKDPDTLTECGLGIWIDNSTGT